MAGQVAPRVDLEPAQAASAPEAEGVAFVPDRRALACRELSAAHRAGSGRLVAGIDDVKAARGGHGTLLRHFGDAAEPRLDA
jgi:hypothetical protein